jgi:hypothetical protein
MVGAVSNRLAAATSPYLLQHKDNPVDWWEWGPEAFEEARRRNVPVLLSVGYAAYHWCQVSTPAGDLLPERAGTVRSVSNSPSETASAA